MSVVLTERVNLGAGAGGYRFRVEKTTSQDQELYRQGKRFQEIARQQSETSISKTFVEKVTEK
jgi:hypothetical protein